MRLEEVVWIRSSASREALWKGLKPIVNEPPLPMSHLPYGKALKGTPKARAKLSVEVGAGKPPPKGSLGAFALGELPNDYGADERHSRGLDRVDPRAGLSQELLGRDGRGDRRAPINPASGEVAHNTGPFSHHVYKKFVGLTN